MRAKSVLISGAGIAGPTLAFWLNAAGFKTTIVERAPGLRAGGYVLDFWGLGYDIAERMGLANELKHVGYIMREMRIVDARGERITGFGTRVFRELTGGRFVTLARADLARLLFETVRGQTEILFGDEIVGLEERPNDVWTQFEHAGARSFDLIVGADGLHSNVRRLAFGPQQKFEKDLGYVVAAFETQHYRPRDEDVYVIYSEPGQMLARFALHDDRTLFLFVFAAITIRRRSCLTWWRRRRCFAGGSAPMGGSASEFSSASIARTTSISIRSRKSKCLPGRAAALRSSETPPFAFP